MRSAPFEVFAFAMLFPALFVLIGVGTAIWLWRMGRALKSKHPVDVSDLMPGYALVWGKIAKNSQRAPLTDRPCAWYSVRVEELKRNEVGSERKLQWCTVQDETSSVPVELTDGKATCFIDLAGAVVIETGWSEWKGSSPKPDEPEPEIHAGPRSTGVEASGSVSLLGEITTAKYRCQERYIFAGDPLFAIGDVEPAVSRLLRADSDEPESEDEFKGEMEEEQFVPDTLLIRKPKGAGLYNWAKPFVVSGKHPKDVVSESQLGLQGGLVLAAIGVALGFFLFRIRYG